MEHIMYNDIEIFLLWNEWIERINVDEKQEQPTNTK